MKMPNFQIIIPTISYLKVEVGGSSRLETSSPKARDGLGLVARAFVSSRLGSCPGLPNTKSYHLVWLG